MRIALVSTCALPTPPPAYGGTELFVAGLARGLTDLGHEVVVYATADSRPPGTLRAVSRRPCWPPCELTEKRHAALAFRDIAGGGFDVVHVQHAAAIPFHFSTDAPCVATVHHDRNERMIEHDTAFEDVGYVAISRRQAELSPEVRFAGVVHHGLDTDVYPYGDGADGHAAFFEADARRFREGCARFLCDSGVLGQALARSEPISMRYASRSRGGPCSPRASSGSAHRSGATR